MEKREGGKGRFEILGKVSQDQNEKRGQFTKRFGKIDPVHL